MNRIVGYSLVLFLALTFWACRGGYSLTGGDVGEAESYSVYMFPNQAPLVNPNLSIQFTENLKQEILQQTPLQLVERGGDLEFSGAITDYSVSVRSAQSGETNAQNRLTVTVNVRLDYLDTSSSKHFYNIFERLNAVIDRGNAVNVQWHFEHGDEDMEETGKDYQNLFNMNFQFIEQEELF